jgi:hypothetical protein
VTAPDVIRVAEKLLKQKPAVAVFGDGSRVPDYGMIARRFG